MALSLQQERVRNLVKDFLKQQTNHYDDVPEVGTVSDSEDEDLEESEIAASSIASGLDWRQYIPIKGKPGSGKSHAVKVVIEESLEKEYTVCCVTPTGILTSSYLSQFVEESFYCDTIHAMFKYPVAKGELGIGTIRCIDNRCVVYGTRKNFQAYCKYISAIACKTSCFIMR